MAMALEALEFPLIDSSKIEPRLYQLNLFRSASANNSLVVLPTGLGKTVVALMLASRVLERRGKEKSKPGPAVVMLAPTKPLVEQHAAFFLENLVGSRRPEDVQEGAQAITVVAMTGERPPTDREDLWREADVVLATPQVIKNDLTAGRISFSPVGLLVLDEAHRASGDYPYVFLAERFRQDAGKGARLLGLTASPGGNARDILQVCDALGIVQIDVRTDDDPDVAPYVHKIAVNWIDVDLPTDFKVIASKLRRVLDREARKLQEAGLIKRGMYVSTGDIIAARSAIQANIARATPETRGRWWQLSSAQAKAMKVNHALEYIETQGLEVFLAYMDRLKDEAEQKGGSSASKALVKDADFVEAYGLGKASRASHPKVEFAAKLVKRALDGDPDGRVILFAHFRETGEVLLKRLEAVAGVRAVRFIGQATRGNDVGLSQKEQIKLIEDFEAGVFNVLVATSVAEEGLDIPQVDHVIFYEPIPSEIRTIQRRGRTGRRRAGSVEVLVARKTRDEAYRHASSARETTMREELKRLRANLRLPVDVLDAPPEVEVKRRLDEFAAAGEESPTARGPLDRFEAAPGPPAPQEPPATDPMDSETPVRVLVDDRELRGNLVEHLKRLGIEVEVVHLDVGDFALPPRLGMERKSAADFGASLVDGRLFRQAAELSEAFERAVFIIEGDPAQAASGVRPQALEGALSALMVDFGVAVVRTAGENESAAVIASLARRAAAEPGAPRSQRHHKSGLALEERQRLVLEGLPGVSSAGANKLLAHFGSIRALAQASLEEIAAVPGIGRRTAEQVYAVLRAPYRPDAREP